MNSLSIAIIGMSGRFPGAKNLATFWQNLRDGVESISFFDDETLEKTGIDRSLLKNPNYIKARGVLDDIDLFDAEFFGMNPQEAAITDPQHRVFLECAWEALEQAGYTTEKYEGTIGLFAGTSASQYLIAQLVQGQAAADSFRLLLANDKDFLTSRVAYKLNLRGPAVSVQTACSTSLVAVHLACQSLLAGECDIALAGGVSVRVPQVRGYIYDGGVVSPDGHCRAFDAQARGTVDGSGVGVTVLKRMVEALEGRDFIHGVILGSAINNDGSLKVGYTAPSVEGQARVIADVLTAADVDPSTISYVEAHGTGTALGDPIEVAALSQAYRARTDKRSYCAIGSVKPSIGHLDAAAGIVGLIKTVLMLKHKMFPPSLNFERPNPQIDFENSPFYVVRELKEWRRGTTLRRAGVSSFGIGGTNAHVILEEAPEPIRPGSSRSWQPVLLSARTDSALQVASARLAAHLKELPGINPADVGYTLAVGRAAFPHRLCIVTQTTAETSALLEHQDGNVLLGVASESPRQGCFLFPGQGSQQVGMGAELYASEEVFREEVDRCARILEPILGFDIRRVLFPTVADEKWAAAEIDQTRTAQPALFTIEYALARLWMRWGVMPRALLGHSIGEFVAACISSVFSLEAALSLVAMRGELMQRAPHGAMLAIFLSEDRVKELLGADLDLAAINGPRMCVVSGPFEAIERFEAELEQAGVGSKRLRASHAFHSRMMDPILEPFADAVRKANPQPPSISYISNLTGTWIKDTESTDPTYWARHLRNPVRFADGIQELLTDPNLALIEVGPGTTLIRLVKQCIPKGAPCLTVHSLPDRRASQPEQKIVLKALGSLWASGVEIDWLKFYQGEQRALIPLPTYPFERRRYWIETGNGPIKQDGATAKRSDISDWFYFPVWKRSPLLLGGDHDASASQDWLIFADDSGLAEAVIMRLNARGVRTIDVRMTRGAFRLDGDSVDMDPTSAHQYEDLLVGLAERNCSVGRILHFWGANVPVSEETSLTIDDLGFRSLMYLATALARKNVGASTDLRVITCGVHDVTGKEPLFPDRALGLGPCRVIPQEYPNARCQNIDVEVDPGGGLARLAEALICECSAAALERMVAYRGGVRWVESFDPVRFPDHGGAPALLRERGVYMITGGLGNIGLTLARELAETVRARLVLIGRSPFPDRDDWERLVSADPSGKTASRIQSILTLEQLGAEVTLLAADVADRGQMESAFQQVVARLGSVHGVIHAAGIDGSLSLAAIPDIAVSKSEPHFATKVAGVKVLDAATKKFHLDFVMLISSLASVLGGLGFAGYSAANNFMDAYAAKRNRDLACPWISVNWDGWLFSQSSGGLDRTKSALQFALSPEEGGQIFRRLLSVPVKHRLVVSTGDLRERMRDWTEGTMGSVLPANSSQTVSHPRPALPSAYVAPSNKWEREIAAIWEDLLGFAPIGSIDEFFSCGGDSLLATQLILRVRAAFQVNLPLRTIFDSPTVAALASEVTAWQMKQTDRATLSRVIAEVKQLSKEQVEALLKKE
jgi:acyl transferase domain-containing protein